MISIKKHRGKETKGKETHFLMWAISSCCLLYAFIWFTSFSAVVRTYVE